MMDVPYVTVHEKIKAAIIRAESEQSNYAKPWPNDPEETKWSQAQATKYEAVLLVLRAALALGELLFGKEGA